METMKERRSKRDGEGDIYSSHERSREGQCRRHSGVNEWREARQVKRDMGSNLPTHSMAQGAHLLLSRL